MNKLVIAAALAICSSSLWAIQGTIRTESDTKKGEIKWRSRDRMYIVSIKKGQTMVDMELPYADVVELDIPEPASYAKAVEMVRKGQGTAAIAPLQKIVTEYKMLQWDKPAGRMLVEAYLAANNAQKAYEVASSIIADDKKAAYVGDLAPAYWQALLKLGKNQQLETALKNAAIKGDRASSASALVMRGDVILAAGGENSETFRRALTDSYLRVALMYTDEPCKAARLEALQRAAKCLDKLGMATRAEKLRAQARQL